MLILASKIYHTPIMGLQTGSMLAKSGKPIIDPANLQILAFRLDENVYSKDKTLVRIDELRELSKIGFIVDSGEDFISDTDVIKIEKVLELDFNLQGMKVISENKSHLGKIEDFTINLLNFTVQQLIVKRPFLKSFNSSELTIHRSQIVSISNTEIVIKSETETKSIKKPEQNENFIPNYVNPFRN